MGIKSSRTILVVGASGFLGQAVMDTLRQRNLAPHGTYRHQAVTNLSPFDFWRDDVEPLLRQRDADTVIFSAAVEPDAPTSELRERATHFFTPCAARRVIYLSGDAIFDGSKGNYRESDKPAPTTLYGRNLEVLEQLVRGTCHDACIVRPSYLYGFSAGALDFRLSRVRQDFLSGNPTVYAEDMFKSPMEVGLAAEAIAELALSNYVGTVHLSGARTSVCDFYRDALTVLGLPTATLQADRLPADTAIPRDTSLDATLMTQLTGVPVLGVREAFTEVST